MLYAQSTSLLSERLSSPSFISLKCVYLFFSACYLVPTQIYIISSPFFILNLWTYSNFSNCITCLLLGFQYTIHIYRLCAMLLEYCAHRINVIQAFHVSVLLVCFCSRSRHRIAKNYLIYRMIDTKFIVTTL